MQPSYYQNKSLINLDDSIDSYFIVILIDPEVIHVNKNNQKDVEKYWKDKEQELGETIKGKDISEYVSGYQGVTEKTWGLLYYSDSSFYFQTFPRRNWLISLLKGEPSEDSGKTMNFYIRWDDVFQIDIPAKKSMISNIFLPPDYRVFIQYKINNQQGTLVLVMYSKESREKFLKFYHGIKNESH
ncbi:MAG: hypothetical protein JXC36_09240 [Candidatus Atribacteria bacterium]|nr:hypothetical protein [Candidatus Atribacteria bacterium]